MQKQKIKLAMLTLAFIMTIFLSSCSEATVNPNSSDNINSKLISNTWELIEKSPTFKFNHNEINFLSDSTIYLKSDNNLKCSIWILNENKSKLYLVNLISHRYFDTFIEDSFLLSITSDNRLEISNLSNSSEKAIYSKKVVKTPNLTIKGKILNPFNKVIPKSSKIYLMFENITSQAGTNIPKYNIIGESSINFNDSSYSIEYKNHIPNKLINLSGTLSNFGQAYIVLFDKELSSSQLSLDLNGNQLLGVVDDRSLFFVVNKTTVEYRGLEKFTFGYNWAKGVYNTGFSYDAWEVDSNNSKIENGVFLITNADILIFADIKNKKFPNWL